VTDPFRLDQVRAAGAEARFVPRSEARLNATADQLSSQSAQAPDAVSGWYVDAVRNSVVITTARGTVSQAEQFAQAAGVDAASVAVVESTEAPRALADIIGGNAYYPGGSRCSIGIPVQGGFTTAGHCGATGTSTSQPTGTVAGSSFPGNDYAWVRTTSADTPKPWVNMYDGSARVVSGSAEAAVGASICRSGSTTGWHCGSVQAKNQTVVYPQGQVSGLTRTNVCAEPGDSGGAWISGNQAQGVTSGGSGDCTSGGTTYFQPVNEILSAYGLSLITG
jgi:streptogrisin C